MWIGKAVTPVPAQGSYVYRVKAVSPSGVSQWSGCTRADTPAARMMIAIGVVVWVPGAPSET